MQKIIILANVLIRDNRTWSEVRPCLYKLAALVGADAAAVAAGIDAIDGIGHTSGWDALAGLMACVEARLDAFECPPVTTT